MTDNIGSEQTGKRSPMPAKRIEDFTDLVVWQVAHELVLNIYRVTKTFPEDEKFGLVNQMRRAGVSVAANIAEGFKKGSVKAKVQFYVISQTSLEEVRYYLILAKDLNYCRETDKLLTLCNRVAKMLSALIKSAPAKP